LPTGSLFLGIDSSGGINSTIELIPRRNRFLLDKNLYVINLERERGHMFKIKKFIPASKIEVSWAMGNSISYSVPTWFLLGS
jgi:hypothetical protein